VQVQVGVLGVQGQSPHQLLQLVQPQYAVGPGFEPGCPAS
jgi:hypothetical protein